MEKLLLSYQNEREKEQDGYSRYLRDIVPGVSEPIPHNVGNPVADVSGIQHRDFNARGRGRGRLAQDGGNQDRNVLSFKRGSEKRPE